MARGDGRSLWIAWPVGLICLVVVGALVWLAVPGLPAAFDLVGIGLRGVDTDTSADDGAPTPDATFAAASDCRSLYSDAVWSELTWTPDALLTQTTDAPATRSSLSEALQPVVRFSCVWRAAEGQSIWTTLADVDEDAVWIAEAALSGDGFSCSGGDGRLHCERASDGSLEIHDLSDGVWLSSVLTNWEVDGYGAGTADQVFPL